MHKLTPHIPLEVELVGARERKDFLAPELRLVDCGEKKICNFIVDLLGVSASTVSAGLVIPQTL